MGQGGGLELGTLLHCKVNNFKMDWTDLNFTFRVQVIITEEQMGWIAGALEDELILNIDSNQQDLIPDEERETEETA